MAIFVFSGILARHPDLKFVSVESGVGWYAFFVTYCVLRSFRMVPTPRDQTWANRWRADSGARS
jgi:hypothetical protein